EKYGRERLQEAADEITECVGDGDTSIVCLTEQARKLSVHLIGPPRPAVTASTDDTATSLPQSTSIPGTSEANASAPTKGDDQPEPADLEASNPHAAPHVEAKHRDWVNFETQCMYQFLMRD